MIVSLINSLIVTSILHVWAEVIDVNINANNSGVILIITEVCLMFYCFVCLRLLNNLIYKNRKL